MTFRTYDHLRGGNDPFARPAPEGWPTPWIYATSSDDQLRIVREADAQALRVILTHPWAGTTVRKRAAARLRKLERLARRSRPTSDRPNG